MASEFPFQKPGSEIIRAKAETNEQLQDLSNYFVDATVLLQERDWLNEDADLWPERNKEDLNVDIEAYSVNLPEGYVKEFSDGEDKFFAYGAVSRPSDLLEKGKAPIFISDTVLSELDIAEISGYIMHEVVEVQNADNVDLTNVGVQLRTARNLEKIHEYRNELEHELGPLPLDVNESERAATYSRQMGEYFNWF